jgi:hypothetical protein
MRSIRNRSRAVNICLLLISLSTACTPALTQTTLQIAPGLTIPDSSVPWALETYQGRRQLVPLHRSDPSVNSRAAILLTGKMSIELRGAASANQLHDTNLRLYLFVDPDQDKQGIGSNVEGWTFTLVRAQTKDSNRIIETVSTSGFGGPKLKSTVIESDNVRMPGHWYRIQSKAPLQPGEYVLLATWNSANDDRHAPGTTIWDFGINSSAPNEADAVPESKP